MHTFILDRLNIRNPTTIVLATALLSVRLRRGRNHKAMRKNSIAYDRT